MKRERALEIAALAQNIFYLERYLKHTDGEEEVEVRLCRRDKNDWYPMDPMFDREVVIQVLDGMKKKLEAI